MGPAEESVIPRAREMDENFAWALGPKRATNDTGASTTNRMDSPSSGSSPNHGPSAGRYLAPDQGWARRPS